MAHKLGAVNTTYHTHTYDVVGLSWNVLHQIQCRLMGTTGCCTPQLISTNLNKEGVFIDLSGIFEKILHTDYNLLHAGLVYYVTNLKQQLVLCKSLYRGYQ